MRSHAFVTVAVSLTCALFSQHASAQTVSVGGMATSRIRAAAVLLHDGRVLVCGGTGGTDAARSAELFDPTSRRFLSAGQMTTSRVGHTATILQSGEVLIIGGDVSGNQVPTAELFDPAAKSFRATYGKLTYVRSGHTATLLHSGKVLIAGGLAANNLTRVARAEMYDPTTQTFTPLGEMIVARSGGVSTLLNDGRVLFIGGGTINGATVSAEVFDPATSKFVAVGSAEGAHANGAAITLPTGEVLVVGGIQVIGGIADATLVESFDPVSGTFRRAPSLPIVHLSGFTASLLTSGDVVLAGGGDSAVGTNALVVRKNGSEQFVRAGSMSVGRTVHTATSLPDGSLLLAGGYETGTTFWSSAELYVPSPTYQTTRVIPVVGSTPGASGSYFKSVVQVHSMHTEPINYQVAFRPIASPTDVKRKTYTLQPGQTAVFDDILLDLGTSGIGTMDIESLPDRAPEVFVHVFNDTGAGTSGFIQRGVHPTKALSAGQRGLMFAPQNASYRMNVGVRALASGATIAAVVVDRNGAERTKVTKEYGSNAFQQIDSASFLGIGLVAGDVVRVSVTAGSAIVYSSQTDNITNDSAFSVAEPIF